MTKDYKNVSETKKKPSAKPKKAAEKPISNGMPGWIWMAAGLVIGSFVSFLVYLKTNVSLEPVSHVTIQEETPSQTNPIKSNEESKEQRFKFYDILPNREVSVPVEKTLEPRIPKSTHKEQEKEKEKEKENSNQREIYYELQVGSFVRFKDADKRKANLAFLGIQAKIQAVKTSNNMTLYRVKVGPYQNISRVNEIEETLKQNNIKSLLVKSRG